MSNTATHPEVESDCALALEGSEVEPSMPEALLDSFSGLSAFFHSVAHAAQSCLSMDFDGTLAPIRVDPSAARPWAGVRDLLHLIQQSPRTRLAIVSGRPASQVAHLLGMTRTPEIWGLHGAECLAMDGTLEREQLDADTLAALEAARNAIHHAGLPSRPGIRVEEKWNAIAVHWRGLSRSRAGAVRDAAVGLMQPLPRTERMNLLEFDGGVELRAGRHKGEALRLLLDQLPPGAPGAYLGDDTTDEDAFRAIRGRGVSVLVRRKRRPTAAQFWLRPPGQLREFLSAWAAAVR